MKIPKLQSANQPLMTAEQRLEYLRKALLNSRLMEQALQRQSSDTTASNPSVLESRRRVNNSLRNLKKEVADKRWRMRQLAIEHDSNLTPAERLKERTENAVRLIERDNAWMGTMADIFHGIGEGAMTSTPITATSYFGAKAMNNMLHGNINAGTAVDLGIALIPWLKPFRAANVVTSANLLNEAGLWGRNKYNIIDDFRRRHMLNQKLGSFNPYKEGNEWHWDANGKLFGKQIGEGSELYVYENLNDPNMVLKIDGNGYNDIKSLKQAIQSYLKRNRIPYQQQAKYLGYMEGKDAATRTKTVYYPVYSLAKLRLETNTTPAYWDHVLAPKINKMMTSKGYTGSATTSFTNGKYTISDMSPYNIGYDSNGNLRFFDFYVE